MKILISYSESYPQGFAMTYRIHCYAMGLIEKGCEVRIVTPRPKTSTPGKKILYSGINEKVNYTILLNRTLTSNKFLNYFVKEISPFLCAFYCLLQLRKFDTFFLIEQGVLSNLFLIPILHLFGKKIIIDISENPYSTVGSKLTRVKWIKKLLKWTTFRCIYPQVDGFIVISENLKTLISKAAKKNARILKVPILINPNIVPPKTLAIDLPTRYIFHAGSLSEKKDGIVAVFEAFSKACIELEEDLYFIITNTQTLPSTWAKIENILSKNNLKDRLIVTGYLPQETIDFYTKNASAVIINKPINDQNSYNFPTKLGDYLRCEAPVIVAAENMELLNYLENEKNALVVNPNESEQITQALLKILTNTELSAKIAKQGKKTALKNFSYKEHGVRIVKMLDVLHHNTQ